MVQVFNSLKSKTHTILPCVLIILFIFHFIQLKFSHSLPTNTVINTTDSNILPRDLSQRVNTHIRPHTIVLAIVVCSPPLKFTNREEASVLLKTIIISARLHRIRSVEIYFFFDNVTRESDYFLQKLNEFGYPFESLKLIWHFKSAIEVVPNKYGKKFIVGEDLVKCRNIRLFLPNSLPHVDSILYLDTDVLVHGNLADLWEFLGSMNNKQLIGMSSDDMEDGFQVTNFKGLPHPLPGKLNSGVLLMNLTRMRQYGWVDKLMYIWFDYEKMQPQFYLHDQARINILLYYNPDLLFRFPCQFNFEGLTCNYNACKTIETNGVQLIHGSADHFSRPWVFTSIYMAYKGINMTNFKYKTKEEFRIFILNEFERIQSRSKPLQSIKQYLSMCESVLMRIL